MKQSVQDHTSNELKSCVDTTEKLELHMLDDDIDATTKNMLFTGSKETSAKVSHQFTGSALDHLQNSFKVPEMKQNNRNFKQPADLVSVGMESNMSRHSKYYQTLTGDKKR